jgi:hypothetical protein
MTDKPITIAAQGTFTSGASAGGAGGIPVSDRDDPSLAKGGSSNLPSGPSPSSAGSNELANALRGLLEIEDARIATGAFTPNVEAQKRIDTARKLLDYHGNEPQTLWQPIETAPSDGARVLVTGGAWAHPEVVMPDGNWWRQRKREGGKGQPSHWMQIPDVSSLSRPHQPTPSAPGASTPDQRPRE